MSHIQSKKIIEQPKRFEFAKKSIERLGYETQCYGNIRIQFEYKGNMINFFPYTGWASGKGIKDCRGIKNLLKQIKK